MTLRKRGRVFWIYWLEDGARIAKSTGTGDLEKAKQMKVALERQLKAKVRP